MRYLNKFALGNFHTKKTKQFGNISDTTQFLWLSRQTILFRRILLVCRDYGSYFNHIKWTEPHFGPVVCIFFSHFSTHCTFLLFSLSTSHKIKPSLAVILACKTAKYLRKGCAYIWKALIAVYYSKYLCIYKI